MIPREELAAMRERCDAVRSMRARTESDLLDIACHYTVDLPRLLAEVDRLRGVADDLARGVRLLEESFDDADGRRPKWLQAALDAAEGGE